MDERDEVIEAVARELERILDLNGHTWLGIKAAARAALAAADKARITLRGSAPLPASSTHSGPARPSRRSEPC